MSEEKYYSEERFVCHRCGKEYRTPGAAESCWNEHRLNEVLKDVVNHRKLIIGDIIERIQRDVQDGEYDDERFKGGEIPLLFDGELVHGVVTGEKYITLRWKPNDGIRPGDGLRLVEAGGSTFAKATVLATGMVTLEDYADLNPDGHQKYEDWQDMWTKMRKYYSDMPGEPDTKVKLIMFNVTEVTQG